MGTDSNRLVEQVATLRARSDLLSGQVARLADVSEELGSGLRGEISSLAAKSEQLSATVSDLNSSLRGRDGIQTDVTRLQEGLKQASATIATLLKSLDKLEAGLAELKNGGAEQKEGGGVDRTTLAALTMGLLALLSDVIRGLLSLIPGGAP